MEKFVKHVEQTVGLKTCFENNFRTQIFSLNTIFPLNTLFSLKTIFFFEDNFWTQISLWTQFQNTIFSLKTIFFCEDNFTTQVSLWTQFLSKLVLGIYPGKLGFYFILGGGGGSVGVLVFCCYQCVPMKFSPCLYQVPNGFPTFSPIVPHFVPYPLP